MELQLNRIQHIGIPVTDIKRSQSFYERLGFKNVMASVFSFAGEEGGQVRMMERSGMILEIYQMPASALEAVHQRKDGHVDHVAFDVDDIHRTFQWMKENGFTVLEEEPVFLSFWTKGCYYFNIAGPDGERLEFNQIVK